MDISDFKHVKKVDVRYDDLDTFTHVNNKAYLSYLEEARIGFHNMLFKWKKSLEFNAFVVRIEINYTKPVFYGDELLLYTRVSDVGNKSFELETLFIVKKSDNMERVADAKVVLVTIDPATGKTRIIPAEEKQILLEYLKNK